MQQRMILSNPNLNQFETTISFRIYHAAQVNFMSTDSSQEIEYLAPVLAQAIIQNMSGMLKHIEIKPGWNNIDQITLCEYKLTVLTTENLTNYDTQEICQIIQENLKKVFKDEIASNLYLENKICIQSHGNDNFHAKYKNKVNKRTYEYNAFKNTTSINIEFINENENSILFKSESESYEYDRVGNVKCIAYKYFPFVQPNASHMDSLRKEIDQYGKNNPEKNLIPFIQSIEAKDYNQALRKACAGSHDHLVKLLFDYNKQNQLNLDINQSSLNGNTPLDYALALKKENAALIYLLKLYGAMRSCDLLPTFAELDKSAVIKRNRENQLNQQRREQDRNYMQNPHHTFGRYNQSNRSFNDINSHVNNFYSSFEGRKF